jgi:hypothetical protein
LILIENATTNKCKSQWRFQKLVFIWHTHIVDEDMKRELFQNELGEVNIIDDTTNKPVALKILSLKTRRRSFI